MRSTRLPILPKTDLSRFLHPCPAFSIHLKEIHRQNVYHRFHYQRDFWRVNQVRNIGMTMGVEPNPLITHADWARIKKKGDKAVREWIEGQLVRESGTGKTESGTGPILKKQGVSGLNFLHAENRADRPWWNGREKAGQREKAEGESGTGPIVFGTGVAPAKRAHFGMRFAPFPDPYQENCQDGRRRTWTDVERSRTESPKPT